MNAEQLPQLTKPSASTGGGAERTVNKRKENKDSPTLRGSRRKRHVKKTRRRR